MLTNRINALHNLKEWVSSHPTITQEWFEKARDNNPWFTIENSRNSLQNIAENFLDRSLLEKWTDRYPIRSKGRHKVGLIMAGNIPLVGFHDWLVTFIAGYDSLIKLSSKDSVLLPFLIDKMYEIAEDSSLPSTTFVERLKGFDSVIATGSDNTATHFEYYFKDYPHVIRHNRNSVAFLTGQETEHELIALGRDVFDYFGLGCRNISHIFLPEGYDLTALVKLFDKHYTEVNEHHKYRNNYDYNLALFLLNRLEHHRGSSIILKRDDHIASRIASLNYSYYSGEESWLPLIRSWKDKIQVVVSGSTLPDIHDYAGGQSRFGEAQQPQLDDYADGVDTLKLLTDWYEIQPK